MTFCNRVALYWCRCHEIKFSRNVSNLKLLIYYLPKRPPGIFKNSNFCFSCAFFFFCLCRHWRLPVITYADIVLVLTYCLLHWLFERGSHASIGIHYNVRSMGSATMYTEMFAFVGWCVIYYQRYINWLACLEHRWCQNFGDRHEEATIIHFSCILQWQQCTFFKSFWKLYW